jgi:hypothetical protein
MRTTDPKPLLQEGASDFERRLLSSAVSEAPPPELVRQLERALGIVSGAPAAAAPPLAAAVAIARTAGIQTVPLAVKVGTLVTLVAGGLVGIVLLRSHARPTDGAARTPSIAAPREVPLVVDSPSAQLPPAPSAPSATLATSSASASAPLAAPALMPTSRSVRSGALHDEIALIDGARIALAAGSPARALGLLQRHDARYPHGALAPEALAVRIEALDKSGQRARARVLALAFLADHPDSPLAERIARLRDTERTP